jgi:hypothetical protein
MNDTRICLLQGDALDAAATALSNAAANQDPGCAYVWPYGLITDEDATSSTYPQISIPLAGPLACFLTVLAPHISPAFKRRDFTAIFAPIIGLDTATGTSSLALLEGGGVLPFEKNLNGVFSPYSSTMTDQSTGLMYFRMQRYIGFAIANAMDEYRGGPNDSIALDDERAVAASVLSQLIDNRKKSNIFYPCIVDGGLIPTEQVNSSTSLANGDATTAFEAQLIAETKRIFVQGTVSPSTKVQVSLIQGTST